MGRTWSVVALLVAGLATGCGREAGGRNDADRHSVVRDSAGVRIVENGPLSEGTWKVLGEPLFTVGWEDDGPQFTWAQSGRILPDGGAVVGEYAEGRVYRLGADGTVLETWGRKGEGPGEYQRFDAILLKGDSVLVSDDGLRRVTLRSPSGGIRTASLPSSLELPVVAGVLSDGRLLLAHAEGYGGVSEMRQEWVFEKQPIVVADLERGTADTIAELPHLRRWYGTNGGSPGWIHMKGRAGGLDDGFAWARADDPAVLWFDSTGMLIQVARWVEEPAPLTAEWKEEMWAGWEEVLSTRGPEYVAAQRTRFRHDIDLYEGPLPYWDDLHVDQGGNVWLSRFPLPLQAPEQWRVLARDGTAIGWVALPGVRAILDITDDRVLAVRSNGLDVPAVVMLRLVKP
jgi:hypothetical protein